MRLSIVGLGKLGAPLAAVFASKGHNVFGVDVNPEHVAALACGRAPVEEPRLQELIDCCQERLTATTSHEEAVLASDLTFVVVPTPSEADGAFSNRHVVAAVQAIGRGLRKKGGYHVINITTTVMPGSTGGIIRESLEAACGRHVGDHLGLCYNPEFVALGRVVHDLLYPDLILLGESDSKAGEMVESFYRSVCENRPSIRRMNLINAEITKLSINAFLTTKISYANMLAEICDQIPGADVDIVTSAMGLDTRIGEKYLRAATAYGGPCFPRDNIAFGSLARSIGARADIAEATDRLNRHQIERLLAQVRAQAAPGSTIGIFGLSYKAGTPVIEESPGIALAARLKDSGYLLKVFDPMALDAARAIFGTEAVADSMADCARESDVVVIVTPSPLFSTFQPKSLSKTAKPAVIIDCWRVLPRERFEGVAKVVYPGSRNDR
jgi:UDPglucose 6-dehydrogenase